jgi:hypothetical protein
MKTVEEVAEEIEGRIFTIATQWNEGIKPWDTEGIWRIIAQALTAYGDACGMKRHDNRDNEVRVEALEEAVKVVLKTSMKNALANELVEHIRALK